MILFVKRCFLAVAAVLIAGTGTVFAGDIKIVNKTSLVFTSVIVDHERSEGRHTWVYEGGSIPYRKVHDHGSPVNTPDTIAYRSKIRLTDGVCKLTFVAADSLCMVYAVDVEKTKKIVLDNTNASVKCNHCKWWMVSDGIQLYFNFINSSEYTIYDIYYKHSDSNGTCDRGILNNTDERLMPGERRKIFVEQLGHDEEYYESISMEFEIYAADEHGHLKRGYIKLPDLSVDDIDISDANFY